MKKPSLQSGMSLIELLVSVLIGTLILAGVFQLYLTSTRSQQSQEGVARIQENMRYLFTKIADDVTQSGHFGCIPFQGGSTDESLIKVDLSADVATTYNFTNMLDGENDTGLRNSDLLRLRYFSASEQIAVELPGLASVVDPIVVLDTDPRYASLERGDIAMISDCSFADVFMITNDPTASAGVIEHAAGVTVDGQSNISGEFQRQYGRENTQSGSTAYLFRGASSAIEWELGTSAAGTDAGINCSDTAPQFCALMRNGEELAEGIQDFQVEYGWRNAAGNLLMADGDAVPDWNAVDRIRVTLTLNSVQKAPTNDGGDYTTKQVSKVIMLRNQLPGEI